VECNERHGHIQCATDADMSYRSYAIFLIDALAAVRDERVIGHEDKEYAKYVLHSNLIRIHLLQIKSSSPRKVHKAHMRFNENGKR